jgi:hypothetical protein
MSGKREAGAISVGWAVALVVLVVIGWQAWHAANIAHDAWSLKVCVVNMRQLNPALAKFQKDNKRLPATWTDLVHPGQAIEVMPNCAMAGVYTIVVDRTEGPIAHCSIHGDLGAAGLIGGHQ